MCAKTAGRTVSNTRRRPQAQQRYVDVMAAGFERSTERGAGRWERSQWKTRRKALRKALDVWDGKEGDE